MARHPRLVASLVALSTLIYGGQARADELAALSAMVCTIANFIKGPYLFCGGLIVIVISAVGIASSESTIMKFVSGAGVGIGIGAAAIPFLQKLGISASYCTLV
ncbi:hypothetical protein HFK91_14370 [Ralstonia pseudosolanacearum]|nr:hypothetical protein [Ralstonia pseudosolanacearum]